MQTLSGLWFIDGIDLWTKFSLALEEGSADFLKFPPKKASTEHDWEDSNGVDIDLSRFFFQQREGVLQFAIFATTEADFWKKHDEFIFMFTQPGLRRFEMASHSNRSYYIYYKECNNYNQVKAITGKGGTYKIAHRFSMVVVEPNPRQDPQNLYVVDEDGHFFIT